MFSLGAVTAFCALAADSITYNVSRPVITVMVLLFGLKDDTYFITTIFFQAMKRREHFNHPVANLVWSAGNMSPGVSQLNTFAPREIINTSFFLFSETVSCF